MGDDELRVVHGPADERYAAPVDPPAWHGPSVPAPPSGVDELKRLYPQRNNVVRPTPPLDMESVQRIADAMERGVSESSGISDVCKGARPESPPAVDPPAWKWKPYLPPGMVETPPSAFQRAVDEAIRRIVGEELCRDVFGPEPEPRRWANEVAARPHRPAEWTVRNEPLDRDR